MDENYIKENTRDWELLCNEGSLELFSYFDEVNWNIRHCIKYNGEIRLIVEDLNLNVDAYTVFTIAENLF